MEKFSLSYSQGLSIFVHIIKIYDAKLNSKDFTLSQAAEELKDDKYESRTNCAQLSRAVFGVTIKEAKSKNGTMVTTTTIKKITFFYDFFRRLKQGEENLVDSKTFYRIKQWINDNNPTANFEIYHPSLVKNLSVPIKQDSLENSWWFQWHCEYHDEFVKDKMVRQFVIVRQILQFQKFSQIHMYGQHSQKNEDQDYVGEYSMGGADDNFLFIQMKMKATGKKNLEIIYYMGTGSTKIAVGQYTNVGLAMYCGPVLMEKFEQPKDFKIESLDRSILKFYYEGDPEVPDYIRSFYKYPMENISETPIIITDQTSLKKFLLERATKRESINTKTIEAH